jgi:YggT family protein
VIQAPLLYSLIGFIADALTVLIIARIAVSWLGLSPWHPVVKWLRLIVDPILAPFRKILPNFSGIDFSPILAIIVIYFIAQILQNLVFGYTTDPIQAIELLVEELVVDIAIAIAIIVFVRILLAVFHADPWHPMVQMVRTMTNPLVAPFGGLQHGRSSAGLDYAAIAALVMYIVLIIVIKIVFGLLLGPI